MPKKESEDTQPETTAAVPDPKGPASCPEGLPANVKVSFSMQVGGKPVGSGGNATVQHRQTGCGGGPR